MKKIINNKLYNTETATKIDSYSNRLGYNDFRHLSETLYQKKNGEFFLVGEGGPMTEYCTYYDDNSWGGGTDIIPLTYNKAKEWAQKHMDVDDYIFIFGEVEE